MLDTSLEEALQASVICFLNIALQAQSMIFMLIPITILCLYPSMNFSCKENIFLNLNSISFLATEVSVKFQTGKYQTLRHVVSINPLLPPPTPIICLHSTPLLNTLYNLSCSRCFPAFQSFDQKLVTNVEFLQSTITCHLIPLRTDVESCVIRKSLQ